MDQASINSVKEALSKPSAPSNRDTILAHLVICGLHFRQEVSEADAEIYLHALEGEDRDRVDAAFKRCLNECEFMPKIHDVRDRMPEKGTPGVSDKQANLNRGKIVREWIEPFTSQSDVRMAEFEDGSKAALGFQSK